MSILTAGAVLAALCLHHSFFFAMEIPVVSTDPAVLLKSGSKGLLRCTVANTAHVGLVSWTKDDSMPIVQLDMMYPNGRRGGKGYDDGLYNITDDFSLEIVNVNITDNNVRYTCNLVKKDHNTLAFSNFTIVSVYARPLEPFPVIENCVKKIEGNKERCKFSSDDLPIMLTCSVNGYYPTIKLSFKNGKLSEVEPVNQTETENNDGTKLKRITIEADKDILYICTASSVPGIDDREHYSAEVLISATHDSHGTSTSYWWIMVIVIPILLGAYMWKKRQPETDDPRPPRLKDCKYDGEDQRYRFDYEDKPVVWRETVEFEWGVNNDSMKRDIQHKLDTNFEFAQKVAELLNSPARCIDSIVFKSIHFHVTCQSETERDRLVNEKKLKEISEELKRLLIEEGIDIQDNIILKVSPAATVKEGFFSGKFTFCSQALSSVLALVNYIIQPIQECYFQTCDFVYKQAEKFFCVCGIIQPLQLIEWFLFAMSVSEILPEAYHRMLSRAVIMTVIIWRLGVPWYALVGCIFPLFLIYPYVPRACLQFLAIMFGIQSTESPWITCVVAFNAYVFRSTMLSYKPAAIRFIHPLLVMIQLRFHNGILGFLIVFVVIWGADVSPTVITLVLIGGFLLDKSKQSKQNDIAIKALRLESCEQAAPPFTIGIFSPQNITRSLVDIFTFALHGMMTRPQQGISETDPESSSLTGPIFKISKSITLVDNTGKEESAFSHHGCFVIAFKAELTTDLQDALKYADRLTHLLYVNFKSDQCPIIVITYYSDMEKANQMQNRFLSQKKYRCLVTLKECKPDENAEPDQQIVALKFLRICRNNAVQNEMALNKNHMKLCRSVALIPGYGGLTRSRSFGDLHKLCDV